MFDRKLFLAGYYLNNLIGSKVGRHIVAATLSSHAARWEELKTNASKSDTWLVVGNGPSLRPEDLTGLKDLPSVASNKIHLLYDKTDWRPTFYTIGDPLLIYKLPASHYDAFPLTLLPHTIAMMARTANKLPWRLISDEEGERKYVERNEELTPLNGFISGATITSPNLMLAMWAGAKTIYLVGCDHFYAEENHKDGIKKVAHQSSTHHFHPDYRKPGEIVNAAPVEWMNRGYGLMRRIADRRGVRIINISRRTALDIFELGSADEAIAAVASRGSPGPRDEIANGEPLQSRS